MKIKIKFGKKLRNVCMNVSHSTQQHCFTSILLIYQAYTNNCVILFILDCLMLTITHPILPIWKHVTFGPFYCHRQRTWCPWRAATNGGRTMSRTQTERLSLLLLLLLLQQLLLLLQLLQLLLLLLLLLLLHYNYNYYYYYN